MGQELKPHTDLPVAVERLYVEPWTTAEVPALSSYDALCSQRLRAGLGFVEVGSGLLMVLALVMSIASQIGQVQDMVAADGPPPAWWLAYVLAIALVLVVVALAGICIGIWNFAARYGTTRPPLIAAMAVSAASIVVILVFFAGSPFHPGRIGWIFVHVLAISCSTSILRLKKTVPAGAKSAPPPSGS